ncbi:uncharacterized protein KIAA0825-like [Notothenia coriiceps]|uniref:Uncharacterized protein KIAA0825-like n=1 Tax=Notothenia coriiceps TaxID=8208 RepID=A0A6I9P2Z9_9TELE|nr:PREDICTED: uncharacterized protein KIAA0825-like [Notothenia coriiceps]
MCGGIEQQLKELQAKMGESRERPPSPSECLQWFNLRANSFRPVPTGHQDLMDFFRALIQYLRSEEEGKEEVTLQLLLNLSSQCGVCFPCTPSSSSSSSSLPAASSHLVHTVRDDTSLEIQEAWDDVRLQLRRHLLERLSARSPDHQGPRNMSVPERLHCLQQLFFLYPESEALTYYQSLRSQSVLALLHSTMSSSPGDEAGFDRLAEGFRSVVPALTQALTEEIHVLSRLAEPHTILGFLNAAYLGTVTRALVSLMERESETALRDNTSLTSKIKKYSARSRATQGTQNYAILGKGLSCVDKQDQQGQSSNSNPFILLYVPWSLHQPERGVFTFHTQLDLEAYINLAAELGLWVILRPGPYISSELDLGGLPSWLLRDGSMKLRTTYPGFTDAVNTYFDKLIPKVVPLQAHALSSNTPFHLTVPDRL